LKLKLRKTLTVVGAVAVFGLSGTAAYAYWTTTGSGGGTAAVSSTPNTIVLHASVPANIVPGDSRTVTVSADRDAKTYLRVGTVKLVSVKNGATDVTSWFSLADIAANETVLHGTGSQTLTATGTLNFLNDAAVDQSSVRGQTLTITLSSD
jgi:GH25 family lysozyme M1 (1,4-beta-N-acetylmuramidase)